MGLKYSTPVDLLADRLLVAFVVICLLRSFGAVKIGKIAKRQKIGLLGLSFLYPTGFFALQISGIEIIPATEASIIYALLPIFTLIGSAILLKEKTSLLQKSGALLSVLGVLYITFQSSINISMNYWGYSFDFQLVVCYCALFYSPEKEGAKPFHNYRHFLYSDVWDACCESAESVFNYSDRKCEWFYGKILPC